MATCQWCGSEYDPAEADEEFEDICENSYFSYANFSVSLCGSCANQAIQDKVDGVYEAECEECSSQFDPFVESSRYDLQFSDCNGTELEDAWDYSGEILCADCAVEAMERACEGE